MREGEELGELEKWWCCEGERLGWRRRREEAHSSEGVGTDRSPHPRSWSYERMRVSGSILGRTRYACGNVSLS